MKLQCLKCEAENDYQVVIAPEDFVPFKFFECWYCGTRQKINAETGEVILLPRKN